MEFPKNSWILEAIGFGKNRELEEEKTKQLAKTIGYSEEDTLKVIQALKGKSAEEVVESLNNIPEIFDRPGQDVHDPARRAEKLKKIAGAPEMMKEQRLRNVDPNKELIKEDAKIFLLSTYALDESNFAVKFAKNNSGKQKKIFISKKISILKSKKKMPFNHMALCPNCAAEFKYILISTEEELIEEIQTIHFTRLTDLRVELPIRTSLGERIIHFTGQHWFDLVQLVENKDNKT